MEKVVIRISDASPSVECDSMPIMIFMPGERGMARIGRLAEHVKIMPHRRVIIM